MHAAAAPGEAAVGAAQRAAAGAGLPRAHQQLEVRRLQHAPARADESGAQQASVTWIAQRAGVAWNMLQTAPGPATAAAARAPLARQVPHLLVNLTIAVRHLANTLQPCNCPSDAMSMPDSKINPGF